MNTIQKAISHILTHISDLSSRGAVEFPHSLLELFGDRLHPSIERPTGRVVREYLDGLGIDAPTRKAKEPLAQAAMPMPDVDEHVERSGGAVLSQESPSYYLPVVQRQQYLILALTVGKIVFPNVVKPTPTQRH